MRHRFYTGGSLLHPFEASVCLVCLGDIFVSNLSIFRHKGCLPELYLAFTSVSSFQSQGCRSDKSINAVVEIRTGE